jgi:hypothetical protein
MTRRIAVIAAALAMSATIGLGSSGSALAAGRGSNVKAHRLDKTAGAVPAKTTCNLWAVVNSDASVARSGCGQTTSSAAGSSGAYDVVFSEDVRQCAYNATIGSSADEGTVPPGFVTVVGDNGNVDGVYVETFNSSGTETPEGFHLLVTCGQPASPACDTWAVVGTTGTVARSGCSGTSAPGDDDGSDYVVFPKNVSHCSYQATIGSSGSVGGAAPGYVSVIRGDGNVHGVVFVDTFNSSGVATPEGFHLSVTCAHAKSPKCDTWAVVESGGTLAHSGCPGATATGFGDGAYDVVFSKDVTDCAFGAATGFLNNVEAAPEFVTVVGDAGSADGVFVETFNSSGTETPENFYLTVTC